MSISENSRRKRNSAGPVLLTTGAVALVGPSPLLSSAAEPVAAAVAVVAAYFLLNIL